MTLDSAAIYFNGLGIDWYKGTRGIQPSAASVILQHITAI